jgi:hypothetical protein
VRANAADLAREFLAYCEAHPDLRFWQALTCWADLDFLTARLPGIENSTDTWNWKGKGPE